MDLVLLSALHSPRFSFREPAGQEYRAWLEISDRLVRKHPLDGLLVRLRDFRLACERGLTAGRFLGQDVRMERMVPLQLPGSGFFEPLRGSAVRLHFRHSSGPNRSLLELIPTKGVEVTGVEGVEECRAGGLDSLSPRLPAVTRT